MMLSEVEIQKQFKFAFHL